MSDFSDRPLVAGSLTGVRAFCVDGLGRLTGVTHQEVFTPGENVAKCSQARGGWATTLPTMHAGDTVHIRLSTGAESTATVAVPVTTHQVGGVDCGCGYYAYFDGSNTYADDNNVTAVIQGYGVCSVGDRGFRAEKAKLVALVDPAAPARVTSRVHTLYDHTADWCSDHDVTSGVCVVGSAMGTLGAIGLAFIALPWSLLLLILAALLAATCAWVGKSSFHGISRKYPSVSPEVARCAIPPRKSSRTQAPDLARVRDLYPEVPIYRTLRAALKDHPLTLPPPPKPPVLPSPTTHDDFWTRSS